MAKVILDDDYTEMAAGSEIGSDEDENGEHNGEDDEEEDEEQEEDEEGEEGSDEELEESAEFLIGSDEGEILDLEDGSEPPSVSGDDDDESDEQDEDGEEEDEEEEEEEEIVPVVTSSRKNKRKAEDSPIAPIKTKRVKKVNFTKVLEAPRSGGKGSRSADAEVMGIMKKSKKGGANGKGDGIKTVSKPAAVVNDKKEKVKTKAVSTGAAAKAGKEEGAYDFSKHFF